MHIVSYADPSVNLWLHVYFGIIFDGLLRWSINQLSLAISKIYISYKDFRFTNAIIFCFVLTGAVFLNDCTYNEWVPRWLLVYGCVCTVIFIMIFAEKYAAKKRKETGRAEKKKPGIVNCFQHIIFMFMFGFFIFGKSHNSIFITYGNSLR